MRKLVFIDIDGTILDHQHQVPQSARTALAQVKQAGHRLFFCTGRNNPEVFPSLWELGFEGIVGANGTYADLDGTRLFDYRIDRPELQSATAWFDQRHLPWIWQTPDHLYSAPTFWDAFTNMGQTPQPSRVEFVEQVLPRVREGIPEAASKAVVIIPAGSSTSFTEFQHEFGGRFDIEPGSMDDTFGQSVEMVQPGMSKGNGLRQVAAHLGFSLADTVGIGDSHNDLEMMTVAGLSIAMGNAVPEVAERADWISQSVDEDGLAIALRHAQLIG